MTHFFPADLDLVLFSCRVAGMYTPSSIPCMIWHPAGDQISRVQSLPEISA